VSTVDHRAQMLDALDVAANCDRELMATRYLALAQVHATALLAEQQRLASLVAVWTSNEEDAAAMVRSGGFNFAKILDEIRELVRRA